ncbi:MAG: hypothetical protein ABIK08_13065 [Pseudomonadota bacterium]
MAALVAFFTHRNPAGRSAGGLTVLSGAAAAGYQIWMQGERGQVLH